MDALKGWTRTQKHAVAAAYLGWTLDAFDFFVMTFVMPDIGHFVMLEDPPRFNRSLDSVIKGLAK